MRRGAGTQVSLAYGQVPKKPQTREWGPCYNGNVHQTQGEKRRECPILLGDEVDGESNVSEQN